MYAGAATLKGLNMNSHRWNLWEMYAGAATLKGLNFRSERSEIM
jgi:hypothetical protein